VSKNTKQLERQIRVQIQKALQKPIYHSRPNLALTQTCWMCGIAFYDQRDIDRHNRRSHDSIPELWWHKIENEIKC
jgi:hypothetical protein